MLTLTLLPRKCLINIAVIDTELKMETILIADSGSTKTDWLLMSAERVVTTEWTSPGINPFFQEKEAISHILKNEVFVHLTNAPRAVFFYGAGCASPEAGRPISDCFQEKYPTAHVEVDSDLLGAARSVCQREAGIACILGTGSNNCLYDGHSIVGNVGSLGFWMGDEGSGGYLGKQLVIAYLHRELPQELLDAFSRQYPQVNRMSVLDRAYKQPFPNRYFATFTHFIAAHKEHAFIDELLRESFSVFLDKYVLKHPGAKNFPVSFVGSVAWHFRSSLEAVVTEKGLMLGKIVQRPMSGLAAYHSSGDQ